MCSSLRDAYAFVNLSQCQEPVPPALPALEALSIWEHRISDIDMTQDKDDTDAGKVAMSGYVGGAMRLCSPKDLCNERARPLARFGSKNPCLDTRLRQRQARKLKIFEKNEPYSQRLFQPVPTKFELHCRNCVPVSWRRRLDLR